MMVSGHSPDSEAKRHGPEIRIHSRRAGTWLAPLAAVIAAAVGLAFSQTSHAPAPASDAPLVRTEPPVLMSPPPAHTVSMQGVMQTSAIQRVQAIRRCRRGTTARRSSLRRSPMGPRLRSPPRQLLTVAC